MSYLKQIGGIIGKGLSQPQSQSTSVSGVGGQSSSRSVLGSILQPHKDWQDAFTQIGLLKRQRKQMEHDRKMQREGLALQKRQMTLAELLGHQEYKGNEMKQNWVKDFRKAMMGA